MMKKLLIFTVLCLAVLSTSWCMAAVKFSDVKNTKYSTSVEMLNTLGLVDGYEDGTYKPENIVKRSEMAKLMVIALGKESEVEKAKTQETKFSDMKPTDWEYGYVNVAANNGIINGYPNGTFGPDKTVSYSEATAMIVRALGYEKAVEQSQDVWPSNYINQAKTLSLYNSIGTVAASEGAIRGNVAILLWNMLRTGVATASSENASGIVYKQGEKMMNRYLTNFIYMQDAVVKSVKFSGDEDEWDYTNATVKFSGEKTFSIAMNGLEAAKMYGQKYDVLYNKKAKKLELLNDSASNDVKTGDIKEISSSRIYLDGGSSSGYKLPDDDNILLYGIDRLSEAVSATVVFKGSSVEYVVAFPPEKVYLALVIESGITVSKKDGIEVINYKASSSKKYALAEDEDMPDDGDIILYYLNNDNELCILKSADLGSSKEVTSATSKKIKLGSTTYTLGDSDEIAQVSGEKLKAMNASSIEDNEDSACLLQFAGVKYFAVYVGGTEQAEKEQAAELKTAKSNLNSMITKAEKISETLYTQATYSAMANALKTAKETYSNSKSTLAKLKSDYNTLKTKYDALKKISSLSTEAKRETETEIVTAKSDLRELVNGTRVTTAVKNKSTYTTDSYKTFNTALTNANNILAKTNATLKEIESGEEKLEAGLNGLKKNTDAEDKKAAIEALKEALTAAGKVGSASNYTAESYANFKAIWDEAKALNTNTATTKEITDMTTRLNNAMKLLTTNSDTYLAELNAALLEAETIMNDEDIYTTTSINALKTAIKNAQEVKANTQATATQLQNAASALSDAIEQLVKVDDELAAQKKAANSRVEAIADALALPESTKAEKEAKITALKKAIEDEKSLLKAYTTNLNNRISAAKEITESGAEIYEHTYVEIQQGIKDAEAVLKITDVTSAEVLAACKALDEILKLK